MFRLDANGVGQRIKSTTLSLGQAYRLLLPPKIGDDLGAELGDGWRIWSLDLAAPLSPTTRQMLTALGLNVGEAWPRLEWALAPAAAWRTNARGESYPVFEAGAELLVNAGGVSVEEGDEAGAVPPRSCRHGTVAAVLERPRLSRSARGRALGVRADALTNQRAARVAALRSRPGCARRRRCVVLCSRPQRTGFARSGGAGRLACDAALARFRRPRGAAGDHLR